MPPLQIGRYCVGTRNGASDIELTPFPQPFPPFRSHNIDRGKGISVAQRERESGVSR
jgi:hypothetical protein